MCSISMSIAFKSLDDGEELYLCVGVLPGHVFKLWATFKNVTLDV